MKKLIAILLVLLMSLSLWACASASDQAASEQAKKEAAAEKSKKKADDLAKTVEEAEKIGELIEQYKNGN